jgi:glycosyltransferase involved in cell wall biosynthesis
MNNPKISIVIPAYNEAEAIEGTLQNILLEKNQIHDLVVVDGGSVDDTKDRAQRYAHVISSNKGRAVQMNKGSKVTTGDVLLFVHADTLLPKDAIRTLRTKIEEGVECGRFRMQFDRDQLSLKIFASYTRFSCFSYGDQCFFVTRELFNRLGGYRTDVPFEDVDFYSRLKKISHPVILK